MSNEPMTLEQLATYLHRDVREVTRLADRGHLPGQKVGGEWRFAPIEINHWLETQMHGYTEQQLTAVEQGPGHGGGGEPPPAAPLSRSTKAVAFPAATKASGVRELGRPAAGAWQGGGARAR